MKSRNEICQTLNIDSETLIEYLNFMAYPEPNAKFFEENLYSAIFKLHELIEKGFNLNDVKDLVHCSEKFCHLVPELEEFLQLSESINLRETIDSYQEIFEELSNREEQYQMNISQLEVKIDKLHKELDGVQVLEQRINNYQSEFAIFRQEIDEKKLYIKNLEMKISQLEDINSDLHYEINNYKEALEKQKTIMPQIQPKATQRSRSAIDINALLEKREKELSIKYQKEILDLKKQVEFMIENKEQKWAKRNSRTEKTSR